MSSASRHWDAVYTSRQDTELSWTQTDPTVSLNLIEEACPRSNPSRRVIDIGGGTSSLPGRLLEDGYSVTVLDISKVAVERARHQLGEKGNQVRWIIADVTKSPVLGTFDLWHDRAVFHFLMRPSERIAYRNLLLQRVPVGGHIVIATFALGGPENCSGLEICQYDNERLASKLSTGFRLFKTVPELHITPSGQSQAFQYCLFRRTNEP